MRIEREGLCFVDSRKASAMHSKRPPIGDQQLVVSAQLLHIVDSIRHIDDLFVWLAQVLISRLDLQAIQFWGQHEHLLGKRSALLRGMGYQNRALPPHITVNTTT